ncbi:hypothetical protein NYE48_27885 [Paenibacillus sp. FSL M7-1455]|uniref:hypothetical protein n=1 Tax=Paenibacillus sp. FSL M7-1455 TaxID=2975316 RepID=UPI0030F80AF6
MEKFLETLNTNAKARKVLEIFENTAKQENLVGEEYREARKTAVMMAMMFSPEAMSAMSDEVYEALNA